MYYQVEWSHFPVMYEKNPIESVSLSVPTGFQLSFYFESIQALGVLISESVIKFD